MGYGTKEHITAILLHLSTPIHRRSFKPVGNYLPKFKDIAILSIELAAIEMVKSGHCIIKIKDKSLQTIDILSLFNGKYFA